MIHLTYLPLLLATPLFFIIPESPMWILAKGRISDGVNTSVAMKEIVTSKKLRMRLLASV